MTTMPLATAMMGGWFAMVIGGVAMVAAGIVVVLNVAHAHGLNVLWGDAWVDLLQAEIGLVFANGEPRMVGGLWVDVAMGVAADVAAIHAVTAGDGC